MMLFPTWMQPLWLHTIVAIGRIWFMLMTPFFLPLLMGICKSFSQQLLKPTNCTGWSFTGTRFSYLRFNAHRPFTHHQEIASNPNGASTTFAPLSVVTVCLGMSLVGELGWQRLTSSNCTRFGNILRSPLPGNFKSTGPSLNQH